MYNQKTDVHVNDIKEIVKTILANDLSSLKQNRETMNIILDFQLNGHIANISFGLKENTLISLQEIEEIDKQLRENINAKFTGKQYTAFEAIAYYLPPIH